METKQVTRPLSRVAQATQKVLNTYVVAYEAVFLVLTCITKLSSNEKTGIMIQSYILSRESLQEKVFGAKCPECPLVDVCYVEKDKLAVRKAVTRLLDGEKTSYVWAESIDEVRHALKGRSLRLGTYGDPSALPLEDLAKMTSWASNFTGYTHFWREIDTDYSRYLMASVEEVTGEILAQGLGYRTYRVLLDQDENLEVSINSIECPHYTTGIQCSTCRLCSGTKIKAKSIYAFQHGVSRAHVDLDKVNALNTAFEAP